MSTPVNIEFLPVEFTNVEIHVEPTTEETVAVVHEQQLTIIEVHVDINAAQAAIDAAAAAQLILQQIISLEGDPGPQITTPGTSTLNELARTYTFEDWAWKWYGPTIFTPTPFTTPEIPEEDEGFTRVYLLVGTATGAYQLVIGDPSDTLPIDPPIPANTIYLTRFVATGAVIGEPEAPIIGTEFVKKNYSNRHTIASGVVSGIYPLPADGRTSFVFEIGGFDFKGFSIPEDSFFADHLYEGKIFYIKNVSGEPINLKHAGATDVILNLPGAIDYVVESSEEKTLMFKFSFSEGLTLLNGNSAVGDDFLQSRWMFLSPTAPTTNQQLPFVGAVINTGSFSPWYDAAHPDNKYEVLQTNGYFVVRANNAENSGYRIKDAGDIMKNPYKGTTFLALLSPLELTNTITRIGIFPTGVFTANVENLNSNMGFIITNGDVVARSSNNSNSISSTSSTVALTYGNWYYFFFEILEWEGGVALSTVRYVIKDVAGNIILDVTHTTGKSSSGQNGIGIVSTRASAGSLKAILGVSYIGFGPKKPNFLNDF